MREISKVVEQKCQGLNAAQGVHVAQCDARQNNFGELCWLVIKEFLVAV